MTGLTCCFKATSNLIYSRNSLLRWSTDLPKSKVLSNHPSQVQKLTIWWFTRPALEVQIKTSTLQRRRQAVWWFRHRRKVSRATDQCLLKLRTPIPIIQNSSSRQRRPLWPAGRALSSRQTTSPLLRCRAPQPWKIAQANSKDNTSNKCFTRLRLRVAKKLAQFSTTRPRTTNNSQCNKRKSTKYRGPQRKVRTMLHHP